MKKTLLATATATAMIMAASSAHAMNAKRAGQGFTDIMGDFTNAAGNPALSTKYDEKDDFYVGLGIGVHVADQGEAIDEAEAAQDLIDSFDADITNITAENINKLRGHLSEISEEPMYLRQGVDLTVAIPNRYLSTSFFVSQRGRIGVQADYQDDAYLQDIIDMNDIYDEARLDSRIKAGGYSVADAGFSFGREISTDSIPFLTSLGLGTNLKYQRLDLATYNSSIEGFDEDDILDDAHEYDNGLNVDLGAVMTFDEAEKWTMSIAARDLVKNSVKNQYGDEFKTDTRVTVGAGFQGDLLSLTAQADLTEHGELGDFLKPVQYASIGAEFNAWGRAALRVGYRTDMNDTEEDLVTAGIGLSPFKTVSIDVAAFAGSDSNVGGVVQFGFRF